MKEHVAHETKPSDEKINVALMIKDEFDIKPISLLKTYAGNDPILTNPPVVLIDVKV